MTKRLAYIDPLKCAKCVAVIHGSLALVATIFFFLIHRSFLSVGATGFITLGPYTIPVDRSLTSLPWGTFSVIALPLVSAVYGWFSGLFVALIYNGAAKWTGGLRFTFEDLPSDATTVLPQTSL